MLTTIVSATTKFASKAAVAAVVLHRTPAPHSSVASWVACSV